ncbi:MAG TPA: hypothetical protein VKB76_14530 [Ktedonobacterales bacterium]|nr:hypothetical protein [Ktedonobacterales bacterium]
MPTTIWEVDYNSQNAVQPVPYQVAFDLSFEIASRPGLVNDTAASGPAPATPAAEQ